MQIEWWQGLGAFIVLVLVAGLGGLMAKVWPLLMQSHAQREGLARSKEIQDSRIRTDERHQVIKEFQDLLDARELEAQKLTEKVNRADSRIEELFGQVRDLTRGHADCLVKNERLVGRIQLLEATIDTIQTSQNSASLPTRNEAIIVTCDRGIIREWNQAATVLFHYKIHEAAGRNVEMLVPDEWKEAHRKGMKEVASTGREVRRGPYRLEGLTKEGTRIPIELVLSKWTEGEGDRQRTMFSASIRQRLVDQEGHDASDTLDLGALKADPVGQSGVLAERIKAAEKSQSPTT